MILLKKSIICIVIALLLCLSCENIIPEPPAEDELLDGPIEGLSLAEQSQFLEGDIAFSDQVFIVENGLELDLEILVMARYDFDGSTEIEIDGNKITISQKVAENVHVE